jgi:hypothetical protein
MAFGHFGVGVGVVKVEVWCKHYMSEVLVEWKPYFMAVRVNIRVKIPMNRGGEPYCSSFSSPAGLRAVEANVG